ncbi:hypothetical protein NL676_000032 [Syzygium grande]|nr:hypothetical protein NL676_000032 [Syzygium grande]
MEDRNRKLSSKDIETWQRALKNVGGISGKESKTYSGDGALIQAVVHEVVVRLKTRRRPVTEDLVGMEDQIAAINKLLDIGPGGVRLIGIYGMGGIGVRETALEKLQEKLLSDISYSGAAGITVTHDGIKRIGDTIRNKKMLIVLDDVDKDNQIQNLIPVNSLYPGDIICELEKREIKEGAQVEALRLLLSWHRRTVTSEEIKWFPHIRFLSLINVNFQGDFTRCLSELRWINLGYDYRRGDEANQRLEATNLLHLENAVVVNLSGLQFTDDVFKSLIKRARKLKVLTIRLNDSIHGTPTFPKDSVLEELTIDSGLFFSEIDCSIGNLRWLTNLRVGSCRELRKLPEQIGELRSLRHLSLHFCSSLIELPDSVSKLESLTKLDVSDTKITRLPDFIGRLANLSYVNASRTRIQELPSTMSKLRQLQTLDLRGCDEIQELPKLPISLTALLLTSTSLLTVPNLSYLTNLVELVLSDHFDPTFTHIHFDLTVRSDKIQTRDLRWIGKLFKLSKLYFFFPNVHAPTVEWGSLSQLRELTLYGLDLPTFKQFPSNLIVLELYNTREKQVHLGMLPPWEKETVSSSSRKSRENKANEQHHVQLLDVVGSPERSRIQDCNSSEGLACLPEELGCNELQAPELIDHWRGAFHFPSSLKMLQRLILSGFPELQDIQFVSTLESLEGFSLKDCSSLKSLGGLSNLKSLKQLDIRRCPSLQVVEGIDELEFLRRLRIYGCRSLERILDDELKNTK